MKYHVRINEFIIEERKRTEKSKRESTFIVIMQATILPGLAQQAANLQGPLATMCAFLAIP